jgi:thymidylate synthase (FAD)
MYAKAVREAMTAYQGLIEAGVSRELARTTLPVSLYTEFYGTVNLHNLLHFLGLRLHEHAQQEIREYAEDIVGLIEPVIPDTLEIWRSLHDSQT